MINIISYSKPKNNNTTANSKGGGTIYVGGGNTNNIDLSNYYTKHEIDNRINSTKLWAKGLSDYSIININSENQTTNDFEVAIGRYNKSISGETIFTIGNGTDSTTSGRSNVFWATNDKVFANDFESINGITSDTIDVNTIWVSESVEADVINANDGSFNDITSTSANLSSLTATTANTAFINATNGNIINLSNDKATINNATITIASATTLSSENLTVKNLEVTNAAHFFSLVIDEVKSLGGRIIITPANAEIEIIRRSRLNKDLYALYWKAEGENAQTTNSFETGDLILCQSFNAASGESFDTSNRFYWYEVIAASTTPIIIDDDDEKYHYITIINTENHKSPLTNSVPQVGDKIVQLGNETNPDRQNAIIISAYKDSYLDPKIEAPSIVQYKGINSFSIGEENRQNVIAASGNIFKGDFISTNGDDILNSLNSLKSYTDGKFGDTANLINTLSSTTATQIAQTKQAIDLTASKIDAVSGEVTTNKTSIANLSVRTDSISSQVTKIEEKFDQKNLILFDVENWGRNLYPEESISYSENDNTFTMRYTVHDDEETPKDVCCFANYDGYTNNIPTGKYLVEFTPSVSADDVRLLVCYWRRNIDDVKLISYDQPSSEYNNIKQSFIVEFNDELINFAFQNMIYFESLYNAANQGQAKRDWAFYIKDLSVRRIIDETSSTLIEQNADNIKLTANGLKYAGITIDGENSKIKLDAENTIVTNNFTVNRLQTAINPDDGSTISIQNGLAQFFNPFGKMNIQFGIKDGYCVLSYYDNDGNLLYDLGPNGLDATQLESSAWSTLKVKNVADIVGNSQKLFYTIENYDYIDYDNNTKQLTYNVVCDELENYLLINGRNPQKVIGDTYIYQYRAGKINNRFVPDTAAGFTTAALAEQANGKYFTQKFGNSLNGKLTNLVIGTYLGDGSMFVGGLKPMIKRGRIPKYFITAQTYLGGQSGFMSLASQVTQLVIGDINVDNGNDVGIIS